MKLRYFTFAVLAGSLGLPTLVCAADTARDEARRDPAPYSDREQMGAWSEEQDRLEKALRTGQSKDFYRQTLRKMGYRITAVNQDKDDYLEYEAVKGPNSYEVQIVLDESTGKAKSIDVTTNMWKAEATRRALQDETYEVDYSDATGAASPTYSDRDRMKAWTDEKERLERSLKPNQPKDYYSQALEDLGYRITAINDSAPDYLEYEIVKGDRSYEVQIDLDEATGQAKEIDVTTNVWQADATDEALDRRQN